MCGDLVAMQCNNCGYIRTSKKRESKGMTKAQHRAIDRINRYFSKGAKLAEWKITPTEYGTFWVSVRTEGNVWAAQGGYIHVGHRGSIEVKVSYRLETPEQSEETIKHLNAMLKGPVF